VTRKIRNTDVARPAPFTPDQVAALVAGEANLKVITKVLNAHRQPRLPGPAATRKRRATTKPGPVPVTAVELRAFATGATPEKIAAQLDASASKRRHSVGKKHEATVRPTRRPRF
jgi:hypothetical protein